MSFSPGCPRCNSLRVPKIGYNEIPRWYCTNIKCVNTGVRMSDACKPLNSVGNLSYEQRIHQILKEDT